MRIANITRRNGKRALGALLLTMAAGAVAPAAQADAAWVEIRPQHSNKCLDVAFGGQWEGFNVQQYSCNGQYNQHFEFRPTNIYGYYTIVARHSGKCMDVAWGSYTDGANIEQWSCHGASNQQFQRRYVGNGYYELRPRHSNKCLDVEWWATWDTANVQQWSCNGGANQRFRVVGV